MAPRSVFGHCKAKLRYTKQVLIKRLQPLRLHERATQLAPTAHGVPWLGFVIHPDRVRVKARKVRHSTRHLGLAYDAWQRGDISFAAFDARVQGWINHVNHADSWGLRQHVLGRFELQPGCRPRGRQGPR